MFVLRSLCLGAFGHAYAQIYMFICSLPCLYLDLYVYVLLTMLMLRSICWCAPCHVCVQICILVTMPCASIALFVSCYISFFCFSPLGRVQTQILWSRPISIHLGLYQRVWIISFMHACTCLLLHFISMFACLDLGFTMLGALCGLVFVGLQGHLFVCGCIRPVL